MPRAPAPLIFWDVDSQVDFMRPEGALYVSEAEELLPALGALGAAARRHGIPVVASADHHSRADAEISDTPDWRITFPPHCMAGTAGAERVPETRLDDPLILSSAEVEEAQIEAGLARPRPEVLLLKQTLDVFSNANTEKVLRLLAPSRIVIYGVALDFCHRKAVEGLWSRGYRNLEVVVDGTKAIDGEGGARLLESWRELGVKLVTAAQTIEGLGAGEARGSNAVDGENLPSVGTDGAHVDLQ